MPKKQFDTPSLADVTYQYLELYGQPARERDFEKMESLFQKILQRTSNSNEIRKALAVDKYRRLPVQIKSPAYERILSIEGRSIALLREYAQEMYEYGPEWNHYADRLWDEANGLESE